MPENEIISDEEIGLRIKRRRKDLGMTQERLALELNVSYQQIQRYENGKNRLNVDKIQRIAHILQVTMDYFFQNSLETVSLVADFSGQYRDKDEERLCRLFREIPSRKNRETVLRVARLASKK